MSLTILPRSSWTTTRNGRAGRTLSPAEVTAIAVHYPATGSTRHAGETQAQTARRLEEWRKLHTRAPRSWADIGYNYAIDQAGRVFDLTGLNRGAHAGTAAANRTSVGVLLILGNTEQPTDAMLTAFRELRGWIIRRLPRATAVRPHSSYVSTSCPGDVVRRLIADGAFTSTPRPPKPEPADDVVRWLESRFLNIKGDDDAGARTLPKRLDTIVADLTRGKPDVIGMCELRSDQASKLVTPAMVEAGYIRAHTAAGNGLYLIRGSEVGYRGNYWLPDRVQGEGRREALLRVRAKVAGHWVHIGVSHLDYRTSHPKFDQLRVDQAKAVINAMARFGRRFEFEKLHRQLIMLDPNSRSWVRDRAFIPAGYEPAIEHGTPGDAIYTGAARPILKSKAIETASDHYIVAATLGKAG